ncbi:hypothetical protein IscW_ISCW009541 [Ixodes scapularis]|uniref:Transmembrane protein n=1 Tax=Ixodes scapularis TaxID=6945 RepID=B7Q0N1_IXOSC|nr:hypothetical protein IscW_ISCW009541 [Ixodes scapularis]|eukprot:XP_002408018.1 hypothetical protein IscW_ISCW009541 [Ixodes scapularis]
MAPVRRRLKRLKICRRRQRGPVARSAAGERRTTSLSCVCRPRCNTDGRKKQTVDRNDGEERKARLSPLPIASFLLDERRGNGNHRRRDESARADKNHGSAFCRGKTTGQRHLKTEGFEGVRERVKAVDPFGGVEFRVGTEPLVHMQILYDPFPVGEATVMWSTFFACVFLLVVLRSWQDCILEVSSSSRFYVRRRRRRKRGAIRSVRLRSTNDRPASLRE